MHINSSPPQWLPTFNIWLAQRIHGEGQHYYNRVQVLVSGNSQCGFAAAKARKTVSGQERDSQTYRETAVEGDLEEFQKSQCSRLFYL